MGALISGCLLVGVAGRLPELHSDYFNEKTTTVTLEGKTVEYVWCREQWLPRGWVGPWKASEYEAMRRAGVDVEDHESWGHIAHARAMVEFANALGVSLSLGSA